jgi:hypothetical protein
MVVKTEIGSHKNKIIIICCLFILFIAIIIIVVFVFLETNNELKIDYEFIIIDEPHHKWFKEHPGNGHLDVRYAKNNMSDSYIRERLTKILDVIPLLEKCCTDKQCKGPILWAGGLIGWCFNKKLLTGDDDLDMFVSMTHLKDLWNEFGEDTDVTVNNTVYKISINPFWRHVNNGENCIDGRVIDTECGLFIDLTGLRCDDKNNCKTKYPADDGLLSFELWPSKKGFFESKPILLPNKPFETIINRYGQKIWTDVNPSYNHSFFPSDPSKWEFDTKTNKFWLKI